MSHALAAVLRRARRREPSRRDRGISAPLRFRGAWFSP